MNGNHRMIPMLCLAAILLCSPLVDGQDSAQARHGRGTVSIHGGLVTIRARDMVLDDLLDEVASQAGIVVLRYTRLGGRVTFSLAEVTLEQALRRLLRGRDYALETGETGVQTLWLLPDGGIQPRSPAPDARDPYARADAISGLGYEGLPAGLDTLIRAVQDDEPAVREAAIFRLAGIGGDQAVDALGTALNDRDPEIRSMAIEALDQIGGARARVILQQALGDADPRIRESAAMYLE